MLTHIVRFESEIHATAVKCALPVLCGGEAKPYRERDNHKDAASLH